jgi:alkylmercury lyase
MPVITINTKPDTIRQLGELFWKLSDAEKRIAVNLYRLLALGETVRVSELAQKTSIAEAIVEDQLARWPGVFRDSEGRVEGFWGLTVRPMKHQLIIEGRLLYAWCAWDTLFIPLILKQTAEVRSACAATGEEISLAVGPQGLVSLRPASAVVSFVIPHGADWSRQILTNFCHWVHFFRDRGAGLSWATGRDGAFVLSAADAFQAARLKVEYEYGDEARG